MLTHPHPYFRAWSSWGVAWLSVGQGAQKLTSCTGFKLEPLGDPETRGAKQVDVFVVQLEKRALY